MTNEEIKLDNSWEAIATGEFPFIAGAQQFQQAAIKALEEEIEKHITKTSPKVITNYYLGLNHAIEIIKNLKAPDQTGRTNY